MAEALLSFGVERLWNLLVRETERFQEVGEQFDGLKNDVETLRCFLEDADAKKHTSAMVRKTIQDIKEIVFDAEDIIETYLLKKVLGQSSSSSFRRLAYATVKRVGLGFEMKTIRKRISKVIGDMQNLGVQKVIVNEESTQSLQRKQRERRQTFSSVNEKDPLVGLEKNVEKLIGYLVDEASSQVVSITGMGGLGKTTLAKQVFNHEKIKSHFPGLAWVCVSQQFKREYVWQTILQQLRPEMKVLEMTDNVLQEKLVGVLETQKTLVVIDDIWREEDWDLIEHVFLPGRGWKVLLTTRNEGVALHANKQCVTFKPECLNFEESWDLFKRIAFPTTGPTELEVDEGREEMGKEMIKHCGGLPLAVKLLGGLLANQYALHEWERIYGNFKAHIVRGASENMSINSVYHVLYLSYEELPAYLKHCFLYLAHFPEDYQIDVETLSYYLAAEEISRPKHYHGNGVSIRDVGDGYIAELVKRNIVISERNVDTSRFEKCQLHDMMREVCLQKAEEELFVQIIGTSTASPKSPCKFRRLVLYKAVRRFKLETEVNNPSLRTLLFIKSVLGWKATSLLFTRHKLMRVLDLSRVKFEGRKVPSSIGKLIHLRYLSLKGASVTHLPSSMRNLKQLLYLNINVMGGMRVYMPSFLKEMQELTYLYLPKRLQNNVKMELGTLVKLETLKNFSTEHGCVRDLQGMTWLRTLSIKIRGQGGYTREALSSSLIKLRCLENLTIIDDYTNPTNDDEVGFILNSIHLRKLSLSIYMPKLPDKHHFPSHLTSIYLNQCRLEEDPMPILEELLHLKQVTFADKAFSGKRMVCLRGGFPQLQKLELWKLEELEKWRVEDGSMPLLHTLTIGYCGKFEEWMVEQRSMPLLSTLSIRGCEKLKELRDRLRFITYLKDLRITFENIQGMRLSKEQLPSHLTSISLALCCLEEDPMPILEKLPHLKETFFEISAFCGKRMVCSRGGFPQLQKLELCGLKELEEWTVEQGSMPLLSTLRISCCEKLKELPDGLRFITSVKDLKIMKIKCMRLSEEQLPSHLTSINLSNCHLEENPMPILEKLLHLESISLEESSFSGRRMVCSRGGFPQLQKLELRTLEELEEWIVEEGSMPLLHSLFIYQCKKLKELPDGLRFITSLESLRVGNMGKKWKKRLSEGGEDYHKVQHISSVRF
ncbi:putative disease resistance protein [Hirschfeldia incana]|nr:putative disease resistance protein [Hirschfeldia incana]KAJ0265913.1 putative disease resistance protein [Hirschfeldia incana]KAJ0265914.1 putative disease resistance protein [Hirschfeldia incana]KAJ0265915.1 putative disease resistance protein [Hirschfeldia incana]KAJ0265916.1 putative disease resistance protein [Hirschfeldia incana]